MDYAVLESVPNINISFGSGLISILLILEYWFLFEKAGIEGWKSLIPFYNEFLKFRIANKEKLYWVYLALSIVLCVTVFGLMVILIALFVALDGGKSLGDLSMWAILSTFITLAISVAIIVFEVKVSLNLAKAFGKSTGFGVGLFFFEPIFLGVLAFSRDIQYIGFEDGWKKPSESEIVDIQKPDFDIDNRLG